MLSLETNFLSSKPAETEGKGWQEAMTFHSFIPVETDTKDSLEELSLRRHQNKSIGDTWKGTGKVSARLRGHRKAKAPLINRTQQFLGMMGETRVDGRLYAL